MKVFAQKNSEYTIRSEVLQERTHIIVPVVMMVEGVHAGSGGPILYTAKELGMIPESWNGIPVTINHPSKEGANISANSPEVLNKEVIGRVFNSIMDGTKLKAEVWLDEAYMIENNPDVLAHITEGLPLDVSVGVFSDYDPVPGQFEGMQYNEAAKNLRPDHLALLPGGTGACSWDAGCGIRANSNNEEGGTNEMKDEKKSSGITRTKFNDDSVSINKVKEVKTMEKEKVKAPCCEDLVNELITNERTKFTEEDKERLLTMEEAFLVKLIPDKVEEVVKEPIANEEPEKVVEKEEVKEAVNTLSAEDQAALAYGRKQLKERRETMIKGIQNNAGEAFPSTVLETYDEETLERIFKAVTKEEVADYSLKSSIKPLANNEQEPLYPGGIEIESK